MDRTHFEEIDSTSDCARRWLTDPNTTAHPLPFLITATRQTAGRGRGARRWHAGGGALLFSWAFDRNAAGIPLRHAPLLGLAVGLGILETVRQMLPDADLAGLGIHWPNDVWLGERKLAGILVETLPSGAVIVGVGLNFANRTTDAEPELARKMAVLAELGGTLPDRETFLARLLERLESEVAALATDPAHTVTRVDGQCVQKGRYVTLSTPGGPVEGFCHGLAPDGGLRVGGQVLYVAEDPRNAEVSPAHNCADARKLDPGVRGFGDVQSQD